MVFNQIREAPDREPMPRRSTKEQVRAALAELRGNDNFRRLLIAQSLFTMAVSATPFFAIFVQSQLGAAATGWGFIWG